MAVKVVQGLVGGSGSSVRGTSVQSGRTENQTSVEAITKQAIFATATGVTSSEAVLTSVKSSRQSLSGEKVRDSKQAKDLAQEIADRIKEEEADGLDAHPGLESARARDHLVA